MSISQTAAYSLKTTVILTAFSAEAAQRVGAGVLKNIESEVEGLMDNAPRDIFEDGEEENEPTSQSNGITEVQIFNGTVANLHCALQATYVGLVR